jgi:hypothetical protein
LSEFVGRAPDAAETWQRVRQAWSTSCLRPAQAAGTWILLAPGAVAEQFSTHEPRMSNKRSDSHLPEEVIGFLSSVCFMPIVAVVAFAATFLPSVTSLRVEAAINLYWVGVAAGVFGIFLLFLARLPLYWQRRFWTFGPRELDRFHRRLYWLAYLVVLVSMGLFVIVWLRLK